MKPDWKLAPGWAKYAAMDGCGDWWWYEAQPRVVSDDEGSPTHWAPMPPNGRLEFAVADKAIELPMEPRP